jgi:hypothetical protein
LAVPARRPRPAPEVPPTEKERLRNLYQASVQKFLLEFDALKDVLLISRGTPPHLKNQFFIGPIRLTFLLGRDDFEYPIMIKPDKVLYNPAHHELVLVDPH